MAAATLPVTGDGGVASVALRPRVSVPHPNRSLWQDPDWVGLEVTWEMNPEEAA